MSHALDQKYPPQKSPADKVKTVGRGCALIVIVIVVLGVIGSILDSDSTGKNTALATNGVPAKALGIWTGSASAFGVEAKVRCTLDDKNNVRLVQTSSRGVIVQTGTYTFKILPNGSVNFLCSLKGEDGSSEIQQMTFWGYGLGLNGTGIDLSKE